MYDKNYTFFFAMYQYFTNRQMDFLLAINSYIHKLI